MAGVLEVLVVVNADLTTFGWGEAASTGTTAEIRLWTHDNFGKDLLINPRDGAIYYWDKSNGTGTIVLLKV